MKKLVSVTMVMSTATALAGWNLTITSGWRVVVGANYNSSVKADIGVSGANAVRYMPSAIGPTGATKAQAAAASKGLSSGSRVEFSNGGYIDPDYSGREFLPEYTWNWYAPAGSFGGGSMNFGYDYADFSSVSSGSLYNNINQDAEMPGFTIELQRNLGQWDGFGIDASFGFAYFCRNNIFKSSGEVYRRTDTVERGTYTTSVNMDAATAEWARNADGAYGGFGYDGPGALMGIGSANISYGSRVNGRTSTVSSMYLDSKADYDEIELTLTLKPYYDVTEWFRVVGTFGAAVSRGHLDFDMWATSNGKRIYSNSESFRQWDCYGIGGLGGMFHYAHMCLGFDFLARFLDRDIEINSPDVSGHLERANWMFRVYAGVEF